MDEIGSLNASLRLLKSTTLRCYNLPTPTIQPTISIQPSNSIQSNPIILNTPQQSIMGNLLIPKTKRPLTPGTCVGPSNFKCSKNGFEKKNIELASKFIPDYWKRVHVWTTSPKNLFPYLVWPAATFCAERCETADVLRVLV